MINDTMDKIQNKIERSIHITEENKKEYLEMLKTLRSEVDTLAQTQKDQAESITGFARMSVHEASRDETNQDLLDITLDGFRTSVQGFEASNPRLVGIVNNICSLLSNIGI